MKSRLSRALRLLHLLKFADSIHCLVHTIRDKKKRRKFQAAHPQIALPPPALLFETFRSDAAAYYEDGAQSARLLIALIRDLLPPEPLNILDWGCGPGRIVRHLPALLPVSSFFGADISARSIRWCQSHLAGISFTHLHQMHQLPYESQSFHWVFGVSVFTHLSSERVSEAMQELWRVTKPGGWLLLTTQGDAFLCKMLPAEKNEYKQGHAVCRSLVPEGHRLFTAFHPPVWMRNLLATASQIHHIPGGGHPKLQQDLWLAQKPVNA